MRAFAGQDDLRAMTDLVLTARPKERGATRARLGTSSENAGMQAAAEAVGYRVESAMLWLERRV